MDPKNVSTDSNIVVLEFKDGQSPNQPCFLIFRRYESVALDRRDSPLAARQSTAKASLDINAFVRERNEIGFA